MHSPEPSKLPIRFRQASQTDVAFIFNSLLKSYKSSPAVRQIAAPVYFAQHHLLLEGLLKQAAVVVACNTSDPTQIFGYIIHERVEGAKVIHYIYVKESYRKLGLAKMLMKECDIELGEPFFITHIVNMLSRLMMKHPIIYNPYLAYYGHPEGKKGTANE